MHPLERYLNRPMTQFQADYRLQRTKLEHEHHVKMKELQLEEREIELEIARVRPVPFTQRTSYVWFAALLSAAGFFGIWLCTQLIAPMLLPVAIGVTVGIVIGLLLRNLLE